MAIVPAEELGLWPNAACKDAEGASGGEIYRQVFFFFQRRSPRTPVSFMPR